jgi:hypothetical protein
MVDSTGNAPKSTSTQAVCYIFADDAYVGTKMRKFSLPVVDMPVRILGSMRVLADARTGTGICI